MLEAFSDRTSPPKRDQRNFSDASWTGSLCITSHLQNCVRRVSPLKSAFPSGDARKLLTAAAPAFSPPPRSGRLRSPPLTSISNRKEMLPHARPINCNSAQNKRAPSRPKSEATADCVKSFRLRCSSLRVWASTNFAQTAVADKSLTPEFPGRSSPLRCKAANEPLRWHGFFASFSSASRKHRRQANEARLSRLLHTESQ